MQHSDERVIAYCIPGLGVNKKLFRNLQLDNCSVTFIEWLSPLKNETLPAYAIRLSQQIDPSRPFVLIGVSFGGMCAIEIAKRLSPLKTILISSCKTTHEIRRLLKALSYLPLHRLFSDSIYLKGAWILRRWFGAHKKIEQEFMDSLSIPPPKFFAGTVNMIVHWKNETVPPNIIQIHGTGDNVLPYWENISYNYTLEKGSHLMILDRAQEINEIINKELRQT